MHVYDFIKEDISNITIEHIAYVKQDVKRDIKYAYWKELISQSQYMELNDVLETHCNKIFDDYFNRTYNDYMQHLNRIISSKK